MLNNQITKIKNLFLELIKGFKVYNNPYVIAIIFLGFSSGLPLGLTGATLDAMLKDSGVTKTAIGLFAIVGTPYSIKFLWAPFIDHLSIPFFSSLLGRRRSWMVVTQILLIIFIALLGVINIGSHLWLTAFIAFCISFFSASQDIVIDAYRVEILDEDKQGAGASAVTFGYIFAMKMISGALAFFLSDIFGWKIVYFIMSAFILVGIVTVMITGEPKISRTFVAEPIKLKDYFSKFFKFIKYSQGGYILLFIAFYKLGDAFIGKMTTPFLQEIGFSNSEIALYLKTFGLFATLLGTFLGGVFVYRLGTTKTLLIGGILQAISNLVFIIQYYLGYNTKFLSFTITFENLSGGVGTAAFVAYISSLCDLKDTASQYALFSSFAVIGRIWISSSSGYFVDIFGWEMFFLFGTILAIPGLLFLFKIPKSYKG